MVITRKSIHKFESPTKYVHKSESKRYYLGHPAKDSVFLLNYQSLMRFWHYLEISLLTLQPKREDNREKK